MIKDIYIIGSGGFAKEVYCLIDAINSKNHTFNICGFIDKSDTIQDEIFGLPIINENTFLQSHNLVDLAIGIGDPQIIRKLKTIYNNYNFPNLIHPNFNGYLKEIKLGKGNIITSGCNFTCDIKIGSLNVFNLNVTLGHDSVIGDCNVVNPGVNLSGGIKIGDNNLIGSGATVLQNLNIGSNSILGASSLLTKDLSSNTLSIGIPSKPIKDI
ncbi:acetyltransferase [Winogradskyella sp. UBA3174]|uniref:acetyltransferase n=1 Tax=Winogradskyella sp. UBA3174 TaxID=1947785 RepID=UPI0025DC23F3|nr:acetyltransferase [Winogradskyella sp. UBA3174]|tara:strand:+ start:26451 stop:27086 length:636 start_codon:yes stop_codon:yes gene_type:complete